MSPVAAPDYGRTATFWRDQSAVAWHAYTHHPFVIGLGDGTLPRSAYLHYLVQDYLFLFHFARAWGLAIAKAATDDEIKAATAMVQALVHEEIKLHINTCAAAGISFATLSNACEDVENIAYTRFVLEAGYSGDFVDLMAALMPCVLGYGEIGARLAATATAPIYGDWIDAYAAPDYQNLCHETGAMLDAALIRRLGTAFTTVPRWDVLSRCFDAATRLEIGFWDMGLRASAR